MDEGKLNKIIREFLIKSRERAKLTQSEVASRSDVFGMGAVLDQRTVSRIEQQPLSVDSIKIAGYLSAVGVPPARYYELLEEISKPKERFSMENSTASTVSSFISSAKDKVEQAYNSLSKISCPYIAGLNLENSLGQALDLLNNLNRKPVIGFFGQFDVGKSTLINTVINKSILPASYTPATCIVNLLMHKDDKPQSLSGQVALFKRGFFPYMIHDATRISEFLIEDGDFTILERLGVHNYDESLSNEAYIAVVFAEAEILKHVWLLDTPGDLNSSDEDGCTDTEKALGGVELADGIVYMSSHNGFFDGAALGFAANILRQRPPVTPEEPVSHLLFILSHCHSTVSNEDVAKIKNITFKRLKRQMEDLVFKDWKNSGAIKESPTAETLSERIQPFWRENDHYKVQTLDEIQKLTEFLVRNHIRIVQNNINIIIKQTKNVFESAVQTLTARKAATIDRIKEVQAQDARFRKESEQLIKEFVKIIASCDHYSKDDTEAMKDYFNAKTSVEGLVTIINDVYDDKKDAQNGVGDYVGQLLSSKLESTLKKSGHNISDKVDSILTRWQRAVPSMKISKAHVSDTDMSGLEFSGFDARAAFISGFAGLGNLGAMALYVSTIASNLGAYILVGKLAGLLVSLGLVGNVTAVTSFVAAIGGPITLGIAIASLIALAVYSLLGVSWQKALAKKVAKAIEKSSTWSDIESTITKFWTSTKESISAGLTALQKQTEEHIRDLKDDAARDYNIEDLNVCIKSIEEIANDIAQSPAEAN
jgi:transcriptional regulator with XRE-family HTH domain